MRSMWKGSLSFGLVNVPVKMYTATEDHDVRFHQIHTADSGRIRLQRKCEECGEVVPYAEIGKGYETETGQRLVFKEDDFEELPVPGSKEIDVLEFVPNDQIDPVLFNNSYYLEPEARAVKPYVLLRKALEETDRTAIVKITIRTRQQLAALRVRGNILLLQTMLWPDEVRAADFDSLAEDVEVRPQELQMAATLIENLSGDFDPAEYTDEYRAALLQVIENKLEGGEGVIAAPAKHGAEDTGQVLDLMAALRASVERSRAERGGEPEGKHAPVKKAPAKTTAAKKAPAKAAPAKTTSKAAEKTTPAKTAPAKTTAAKTTATKTAAKTTAAKTTAPEPVRKTAARKRA